MKSASGISASSGAASGRFFLLTTDIPVPDLQPSRFSQEKEYEFLVAAVDVITKDLAARAARATGETQEILLATTEIASDPAILEEAKGFIGKGHTAAYAILQATKLFQELLAQSGGYLAERVSDVGNICDRILCELNGQAYPEIPDFDEPIILIAHDLSPADTTDLSSDTVLAIITEQGGPTSHTAIIARSLGIPAIVACNGVIELANENRSAVITVNATDGIVNFSPSKVELDEITQQINLVHQRKRTKVERGESGYQTTDQRTIAIYANIGSAQDVPGAIAAGADGIGLLRTELLYLDRQTPPSLTEQIALYTSIFQEFRGKRVVIRTLDAGADKPMNFINFDSEPNPALGVRGFRTERKHPELLATQIQAIAQAEINSGADVWVMAPMITLPQEAADFVNLCRSFGIKNAGIMIEVPAAVFHAHQLTEICDFVSIGTNDLGQYLHAADRESAALASFNDPWQPALLTAVRMVAEAGKANNCPVGVCGEAASDPALGPVLIGLGVTSLSCNIATLTDVARVLTHCSTAELASAAKKALSATTAQSARAEARSSLAVLKELAL